MRASRRRSRRTPGPDGADNTVKVTDAPAAKDAVRTQTGAADNRVSGGGSASGENEKNNATWDVQYTRAQTFLMNSGGCYPSQSGHGNERAVASWMDTQRAIQAGVKSSGSMNKARFAELGLDTLLEQLPGWTWSAGLLVYKDSARHL